MNKHTLIVGQLILGMAAGALVAPGAIAGGPSDYEAFEAVVRVEDGEDAFAVAASYNATIEAIVDAGSRPRYLFGLPPELPAYEFVVIAEGDPRIKDAKFNYFVGDPDPGTQSFFFNTPLAGFISQPARAITSLNRPAQTEPPPPPPAPGIIVAVIDTGVDPGHVMLEGRVLDGMSFVPTDPTWDDSGDGIDSDFDGVTDELAGHGTLIGGLIRLVAPEAMILPVRVLDSDGRGNVFRVAQGIDAAVAAGARVVNISLGAVEESGAIEEVILDAQALGVVFVASVGNAAVQFPVQLPSAYAGVIAVAATDNEDLRAPFSNWGAHVALSAPGVDIGGPAPGGEYNSASGTSFSTALVAGAAARILAFAPASTPAQVRAFLEQGADPIDAINPDYAGLLGAGRLNVEATLALAGGFPALIAGDLNIDGTVDSTDLNILLSVFGEQSPAGDADGDGTVTTTDLNILLSSYGGH